MKEENIYMTILGKRTLRDTTIGKTILLRLWGWPGRRPPRYFLVNRLWAKKPVSDGGKGEGFINVHRETGEGF